MCSSREKLAPPEVLTADDIPPMPVQPSDDAADDVWESEMREARAAAERHPWGRFVHLYGDDTLPYGERPPPPSDEEVLRRMADAEALVTQLTARSGRDLLELRRRRLDLQAQAHPDHRDPATCTRACCDEDGWVGLEVAQALAVSERVVAARIETAERLERFGHVAEACDDGLLQSWTATKLLDHLDALARYLGPDRLEQVEAATVAWMLDRPRTVGQLNARMRRLLLAARSAAADESDDGNGEPDARRDAAAANAAADAQDRSVRVSPLEMDGLATLVARLPEQDALAIGNGAGASSHPRRPRRHAHPGAAPLRPGHDAGDGLSRGLRPPGGRDPAGTRSRRDRREHLRDCSRRHPHRWVGACGGPRIRSGRGPDRPIDCRVDGSRGSSPRVRPTDRTAPRGRVADTDGVVGRGETGDGIPAPAPDGAPCPASRRHLPGSGVRAPRRTVRLRPRGSVPGRCDLPRERVLPLSAPPSTEDARARVGGSNR